MGQFAQKFKKQGNQSSMIFISFLIFMTLCYFDIISDYILSLSVVSIAQKHGFQTGLI